MLSTNSYIVASAAEAGVGAATAASRNSSGGPAFRVQSLAPLPRAPPASAPVHAGMDRGVQGREPRVGDVRVLEGRGAARSLQQIIRPQDVVAEHADDRRD